MWTDLGLKVKNRHGWLLRSTADSIMRLQSNVTSANQLYHLSVTSLTSNVALRSVVPRCMNLVGQIKVHIRQVIGEVNN